MMNPSSILRDTAKLVAHLGARLDALSLDLARDVGTVVREAEALATLAVDRATTITRATPRSARIAQAAAAIFARQRWLRLAAAARGHDQLRPEDHRDLAKRTATAAAQLRGGIAKLGQLASCRPDLVGPIWAGELAALQSDVPPVPADAIRARIEAALGRPIAEVFAEFDDVPLAAASLAQVHAATLLDRTSASPSGDAARSGAAGPCGGTRVAVKVQVPGIEDTIAADIAALRAIAAAVGEVPGLDLPTLTDELARALAAELDYEAEGAALVRFGAEATVIVPKPIPAASGPGVLTMTRIDGARLNDFLTTAEPAARDRVLAALVGEVAAQILVRGRVHADPHPGNFLVTADGRLALLDFGCTLDLAPAERAAYARLVLAIAGGNTAEAGAQLAVLGFAADDPAALTELTTAIVGALRPGADVAALDWQAAFGEQLARAKQLRGLAIPRSFVLLGRVLATVAGLLAQHKPNLQLYPLIAPALAAAAK
ncbi:MAG TPA: AarF/UbiB family protein [Kofleriaceae bacterium]|jgi:ubiquinone biosynthesis protein